MKPPSESPNNRVLFGGEQLRGAYQRLVFVDLKAGSPQIASTIAGAGNASGIKRLT
jgi:hypothetical protein